MTNNTEPKQPHYKFHGYPAEEAIRILKGYYRSPYEPSKTERLEISESIEFYQAQLGAKNAKAEFEKSILEPTLSKEQIELISSHITQYNQIESQAKFETFLEIMKLLESQIQETGNLIPELQELLNRIEDKNTFMRSIRGLAYGRGGAMSFPNFIVKHLTD